MKRLVNGGFLKFNSNADGWNDSISLVDEGRPGEAGGMPLVMDDFKKFDGKEVIITVQLAEKCPHGYGVFEGQTNCRDCTSLIHPTQPKTETGCRT